MSHVASPEDLAQRLDRWNADRSARADASRKLAARWAKLAMDLLTEKPLPFRGGVGVGPTAAAE